MNASIGQVTLFVKDLNRMTSFYRDALALLVAPSDAPNELACFDAGGCRFCLVQIPLQYAQNIIITNPPTARSENPIKIVFSTTDIAATRAVLAAHGARMQDVRKHASHTFCDGVDPEGNVFQISNR